MACRMGRDKAVHAYGGRVAAGVLVACFALVAAVVLAQVLPFGNAQETQVEPVRFSIASGDEGALDANPNTVGSIAVEGRFDSPLRAGDQLFFFVENLEVRFLLNGSEVYAFGAPEDHPATFFSSGSGWGRFVVPRDVSDDDVWSVELSNAYSNNYLQAYRDFFDSVVVGDSGALARSVFFEHWLPIVASLFMLFASMLLLAASLMLTMRGIGVHASVFFLAGFTVSVGVMFLLTPRFSTLLVGNSVLVMFLEIVTAIASLVFAVLYLGSFMEGRPRRVNDALLAVVALFSLAYAIAQAAGLTDAYAFRTPLMVLVGASSVVAALNVGYAIRTSHGGPMGFLVVPGLLFLGFLGAEIANYQFEFFEEKALLLCGLALILVSQFVHAIRYIEAALLQARRVIELEQELTQGRISLMLSQIQPHFLFNSLAVIKSLCQTDAKRAERAVDCFSEFLRGDLNSLTNAGTIPFEQELSHVRSYVELERMRFGDRLRIVWDTPVVDFRVPPLTVQPIVENAVRHGVMGRREGGTVRIGTREEGAAYVITVEDDGLGFDPDAVPHDGRAHVGIGNVRLRLEGQCGGRVAVTSVVGGGTAVAMTIPKRGDG